ncbi:hypothetical protein AVDCRST_MAG94-5917 [uncultured Leptolyngbya sp.]|uniref:Uncharacterized protein n=1 Tax=uncultured Leptolyngbya sp. TaxID=332963 RepID=A0A6J4P602_9CYAN|nr:hypothetical protein AVDCRST_MAG94-5917 [uncultured Leptolyngbya sp.]
MISLCCQYRTSLKLTQCLKALHHSPLSFPPPAPLRLQQRGKFSLVGVDSPLLCGET